MDWDIIISEKQIQDRLLEMAREIDHDYEGKEITAIVLMRGAMFFAAELTMKMKTKVDLEFAFLKSYVDDKTTGTVSMQTLFTSSLEGKDILIIEDLVDTGTSLKYFMDYLKTQNVASIKLATLVHKNKKSDFDIPIDYNGFDIEDTFIVGFGMDYNNLYRNIPFIADMKKSLKKK